MRTSLAGRAAIALAIAAVVAASGAALAARWLASTPLVTLTGVLVAAPVVLWLSARLTRSWVRILHAVKDGIVSMRDNDFSVSVSRIADDELGELVSAYNSLGDLLRRQRLDINQRELLLDTVIQSTPLVMVLTNSAGRVVYSNLAARQLLHAGRKLEGLDFPQLLESAPAPLRAAVAGASDTLFTMEVEGEPQVYHLSQRRFHLNAQPQQLVLLKQLTRELAAQEVRIWKKVIRVIAHELNNSLAPISSLAHSGQLLASDPQPDQLRRVFTTIAERAAHLGSFIEGYARFAKLPRPRPLPTEWSQLLGRLEGAVEFRLEGALPARQVSLDPSQIEQVLINLLKNAAESGSPPDAISVRVRDVGQGFVLEVLDRGSGLTEPVLRDALLPFYSTKPTGSGLGLTLCREIVEAHSGRLSLANRADGPGAVLTLWLP
ncbi:MAG TPA: ATP-binding protein [Steroidobacteraceae bacterium]|jgi:nitrogen fixation/metabolism regulation signal transduction histidine kinase